MKPPTRPRPRRRILVVDDSAVVARVLRALLETERDLEVVGEARDGREALARVRALRPDLVTMDIQMPVMDGLEATARIMAECPTPIVVVTGAAHDDDVQAGFRAIEAGALAVIDKPAGPSDPGYLSIRRELVDTVRAMAGMRLERRRGPGPVRPPAPGARPPFGRRAADRSPEAVGIGASTGGPQALRTVLAALPARFPAPVLVVQHISPGFIDGFARWMAGHCALPVGVVRGGERLEPGRIYVAAEGRHLRVDREGSALVARLGADPPVHGFRPAVSPLLASLAETCPGASVGVVLTGMGEDGADGLLAMRRAGCVTIAQDRETSVVYGMPRAAAERKAAVRVLPLGQIGPSLVAIATRPVGGLRAVEARSPAGLREGSGP